MSRKDQACIDVLHMFEIRYLCYLLRLGVGICTVARSSFQSQDCSQRFRISSVVKATRICGVSKIQVIQRLGLFRITKNPSFWYSLRSRSMKWFPVFRVNGKPGNYSLLTESISGGSDYAGILNGGVTPVQMTTLMSCDVLFVLQLERRRHGDEKDHLI